jgi:hypothetical protein
VIENGVVITISSEGMTTKTAALPVMVSDKLALTDDDSCDGASTNYSNMMTGKFNEEGSFIGGYQPPQGDQQVTAPPARQILLTGAAAIAPRHYPDELKDLDAAFDSEGSAVEEEQAAGGHYPIDTTGRPRGLANYGGSLPTLLDEVRPVI